MKSCSCTRDLEIFFCKIFLWFAYTMKIKYSLQLLIIMVSTFLYTQFHSPASLLFCNSLCFDLRRWLIANAWQLTTQCLYFLSTFLQFFWFSYASEQLANYSRVEENQKTWQHRINLVSIKNFLGYPGQENYYMEN